MIRKFQISNFKFQIPARGQAGFTLVEILVTLGIVALLGTTVLSILFITLRVSRKSDVLIELKQSGNSVMTQIVKQIRYAKSLDSPTSCVTSVSDLTSITVTSSLDNAQTIFSCKDINLDDVIASNGASIVDLNAVVVTNCSFSCSQPTLNDTPTIGIKFTLSKPTAGLSEFSGSVPFQSSVIMRNLSR